LISTSQDRWIFPS